MVDINKAINKYGISNPDFASLTDVKLTREILKVSIMTKVYNVTTFGIVSKLKNKLQNVQQTPKVLERGKFIKFSSSENVSTKNLLKQTGRTKLSGESGELFNSENSENTLLHRRKGN